VGRLAGNWFFLVDRTVLAAFKGPAAVAGYAVPYSLTALLHGGVGSAASALFPASTHLAARGDGEALRTLYCRAARLVTAVAAPVSALLLFLPGPILGAWIGEEFAREHAPVLAILAATFFLHSFNIVPFTMTEGLGHPRATAAFAAASTALNLAGCLWLVPAWGPVGAAWANLLSTAPLLPFLWWFWTRCLGIARPGHGLRQVLGPLPSVLPVVLFLASIRHLATSLPRLAAICAVCGGLYLASTWWLSAEGRQDIRDGLRAVGAGRRPVRSL
jgi:O-antigen/teichoic acid export membrane protein